MSVLNRFGSPFLALHASFWPLFLSLALLGLVFSFLSWINGGLSLFILLLNISLVVFLSFSWWRDVVRESLIGYHTSKLELSFRIGVILFIASEVFFFVSFFWAFYDRSLSPSIDMGIRWPPIGVLPLGVYSVPLLNTVILLSSGVTVTWSHHSLVNNNFFSSLSSLFITVLLGFYFLVIQYAEYCESAFTIADGVYGRTFFIRTGFHGIHVIVGTTMLAYTFVNIWNSLLLFNHHFMFEASAWYWHFVDVVWLFLYISIYWWGSL